MQGLNTSWHDDTIFVMCPQNFCNKLQRKRYGKENEGS